MRGRYSTRREYVHWTTIDCTAQAGWCPDPRAREADIAVRGGRGTKDRKIIELCGISEDWWRRGERDSESSGERGGEGVVTEAWLAWQSGNGRWIRGWSDTLASGFCR